MDATVGDIFPFAGTFLPAGTLYCNGQTVLAWQWPALAALLGTRFGGAPDTMGNNTIGVPNIPPLLTDDGKSIPWVIVGDGTPFSNGLYGLPGEVRPFAVPPAAGSPLARSWVPCDGRSLDLNRYRLLLELIDPSFPSMSYTLPNLPGIDGGHGQTLSYYLCTSGSPPIAGGCDAHQVGGNDVFTLNGFTYDRMIGSLTQVLWTPPVASTICGLSLCEGQTAQVNNTQQLYTVLGYTYGGNGGDLYGIPRVTNRSPKTFLIAATGVYPSPS